MDAHVTYLSPSCHFEPLAVLPETIAPSNRPRAVRTPEGVRLGTLPPGCHGRVRLRDLADRPPATTGVLAAGAPVSPPPRSVRPGPPRVGTVDLDARLTEAQATCALEAHAQRRVALSENCADAALGQALAMHVVATTCAPDDPEWGRFLDDERVRLGWLPPAEQDADLARIEWSMRWIRARREASAWVPYQPRDI